MFTTDTREEAEHLQTLFTCLVHSGALKGKHVVRAINQAKNDHEAYNEMTRLGRLMALAYETYKERKGGVQSHRCEEMTSEWYYSFKDGQRRLFKGDYEVQGVHNFCMFCGSDLREI